MQPYPDSSKKPTLNSNFPDQDEYRNSSVLVPIATWEKRYELILTLRTEGIAHGGQLSFPGGGQEGDESLKETAVRESYEEIGLLKGSVKVAGELSPLYVNHSNNLVTPYVGFIDEEQIFTPNPNEVHEVFRIPLNDFLLPEKHVIEQKELKGTPYIVPYWDIHHVPLWGATAMMVSELIELYRNFQRT